MCTVKNPCRVMQLALFFKVYLGPSWKRKGNAFFLNGENTFFTFNSCVMQGGTRKKQTENL